MTGPNRNGTGGLAERQAALVAALVAGGEPPAGFDPDRLAVAGRALLRKRAGEIGYAWPLLVASLGPQWTARFTAWAAGRAPNGTLRDGWDFARQLAATGDLPEPARSELAAREADWRYDGNSAPRRRGLPARLGRRLIRLLARH